MLGLVFAWEFYCIFLGAAGDGTGFGLSPFMLSRGMASFSVLLSSSPFSESTLRNYTPLLPRVGPTLLLIVAIARSESPNSYGGHY